MAIRAYIFIGVEGEEAKDAYKSISEIKGVKSLDAVTGPYDMIAIVEVQDLRSLGEMVVSKIRGIDGVIETMTNVVVDII